MPRFLTLLHLAAGAMLSVPGAAVPKTSQQLTVIDVQVCEALEPHIWFNADAEPRWVPCQKPLKGIRFSPGPPGDSPTTVVTDDKGRAQLGPLTLKANKTLAIAIWWTPKVSQVIRFSVDSGPIQEGHNKMLIFAIPGQPVADSVSLGS